jgi:ketosteroid isomerase-like protein
MKAYLKKYLVILFASACLIITAGHSFGEPDAPDAAIVSTVEAFHKALEAGEPDKVMALLAPDALIIESGYIQTRNDYHRVHLTEDIAFARAVPVASRNLAAVRQEGNVAWVTTTSRMVGEFHKKPVDSTGTETVVLTKATEGWRICTIHWSSHSTPPKEASDHS